MQLHGTWTGFGIARDCRMFTFFFFFFFLFPPCTVLSNHTFSEHLRTHSETILKSKNRGTLAMVKRKSHGISWRHTNIIVTSRVLSSAHQPRAVQYPRELACRLTGWARPLGGILRTFNRCSGSQTAGRTRCNELQSHVDSLPVVISPIDMPDDKRLAWQ